MTSPSICYQLITALAVMTSVGVTAINIPQSASALPNRNPHTLTSLAADNSWQNMQLVRTLQGHSQAVGAIAISADGQTLISGSDDGMLNVWELKTGKLVNTLTRDVGMISSLAISPNGETLLSGSSPSLGSIKQWNLRTGKLVRTLHQEEDWVVSNLAISPDGKTGASATQKMFQFNSETTFWDLQTGKVIGKLENPTPTTSLVFSPNGEILALGGDDGTIKLWDWRKSELLHTLEHSKAIKAIAFSRDGQTLVSESLDETVKVWNPHTGTLISTPIENSDLTFINAVALHPSGQVLASASGGENSQLRLWNLQTGSKLNTLTGFSSSIFSLAFSPNGQTLISGNHDGTITIWQSR